MAGEKILITDDEQEIRELIARYLTREGFAAVQAENGEKALELLAKTQFDLIILDIMMNGLDGFDIIRQIRLMKIDCPVIFLSARGEDYDKVLGLGLGADDYVTKPFSPAELTARIKAHIRRSSAVKSPAEGSQTLVKGTLTLDLKTYTVYKNNKAIDMSAKELKLLRFFMESPNQVFTKKQIYRNVWEDDFYDDNSVMVYISHLREKIEDSPKDPAFIQTVWGIGYKFCI